MKRSVDIVFRIALFAIIIINFSCNKEEIGSGGNSEFILIVNKYYTDTFAIYCTNQHGIILFDTIGKNINKVIKFKVASTDIIDMTAVIKSSTSTNIETFKDIKTEYLFGPASCTDEIGGNTLSLDNYEMVINGISDYSNIIFPTFSNIETIKDDIDNQIIIKGKYIPSSDMIITILPKNSIQHLSYQLKNQSKILTSPGNYRFTLNINDFKVSEKHEILLSQKSNYGLDAKLLTANGEIITILTRQVSGWFNETNLITIFAPPLDIKKIKLSANLNYSNPYSFQKYFSEFPTNISLYNPEIEIDKIGEDYYNVEVNSDYDFSNTEYLAWNAQWNVYQKKSDNLQLKTPSIPEKILNGLNLKDNVKFSQFNLKIQKFNTNSNFERSYNESSGSVNIYCNENEGKTIKQIL